MSFNYRYLATGSSFRSLAFSFRMGVATVKKIIEETVSILWEVLQPLHMTVPNKEKFLEIAQEFYNVWNFPHVLGAIDGKHVKVKCPDNSGSMFFNYKGHFSIVLQGIVDAKYRFVFIDVGGYGKQSDGGTLQASDFYKVLKNNGLDIPDPAILPGTNVKAPYVFIADQAYPLLNNMLKPYPGSNLTIDKASFNARLSRARKSVECAFGILCVKWRILSKSIETKVEFFFFLKRFCLCRSFTKPLPIFSLLPQSVVPHFFPLYSSPVHIVPHLVFPSDPWSSYWSSSGFCPFQGSSG